jgi:peptidoglycan hydrolase-like protein with peptidoglycan-binding domain
MAKLEEKYILTPKMFWHDFSVGSVSEQQIEALIQYINDNKHSPDGQFYVDRLFDEIYNQAEQAGSIYGSGILTAQHLKDAELIIEEICSKTGNNFIEHFRKNLLPVIFRSFITTSGNPPDYLSIYDDFKDNENYRAYISIYLQNISAEFAREGTVARTGDSKKIHENILRYATDSSNAVIIKDLSTVKGATRYGTYLDWLVMFLLKSLNSKFYLDFPHMELFRSYGANLAIHVAGKRDISAQNMDIFIEDFGNIFQDLHIRGITPGILTNVLKARDSIANIINQYITSDKPSGRRLLSILGRSDMLRFFMSDVSDEKILNKVFKNYVFDIKRAEGIEIDSIDSQTGNYFKSPYQWDQRSKKTYEDGTTAESARFSPIYEFTLNFSGGISDDSERQGAVDLLKDQLYAADGVRHNELGLSGLVCSWARVSFPSISLEENNEEIASDGVTAKHARSTHRKIYLIEQYQSDIGSTIDLVFGGKINAAEHSKKEITDSAKSFLDGFKKRYGPEKVKSILHKMNEERVAYPFRVLTECVTSAYHMGFSAVYLCADQPDISSNKKSQYLYSDIPRSIKGVNLIDRIAMRNDLYKDERDTTFLRNLSFLRNLYRIPADEDTVSQLRSMEAAAIAKLTANTQKVIPKAKPTYTPKHTFESIVNQVQIYLGHSVSETTPSGLLRYLTQDVAGKEIPRAVFNEKFTWVLKELGALSKKASRMYEIYKTAFGGVFLQNLDYGERDKVLKKRKKRRARKTKIKKIANIDIFKDIREDIMEVSKGDNDNSGKPVSEIQKALASKGYLLMSDVDGAFGQKTFEAVKKFQQASGLTADGIVGDKTIAVLVPELNEDKESNTVSSDEPKLMANGKDIVPLAKEIGISPVVLAAVMQVESPGSTSAIRFEPHLFNRAMQKAGNSKRVPYTPGEGGISFVKSETDLGAFQNAMKLDPKVAVESTSFGSGQVMGYNLLPMYGGDVQKALNAFWSDSADVSNKLLIQWFKANPRAITAAANLDFAQFARIYNGPAYRANKYDEKLAKAYKNILAKNPAFKK